MYVKLLLVAALATTTFADTYTLYSLNQIREAAATYNKSLSDWNGNYLGAVSMLQSSVDLINTLKDASTHPNATSHDDKTPEESEQIELEVFQIAQNLAEEVGSAVDTGIASLPKIEAIPVIGKPLALQTFKSMRAAASNLGNVFTTKASQDRLEASQTIMKQIDDHFERGITAFQ